MILPAPPVSTFETAADLLECLGGISPRRVRFKPLPGTATEQDVIDLQARTDRLYELVDGVLVEKAMGYYESRLAVILIHLIQSFLDRCDLGVVAGEAGMLRLAAGLVRIPDVSFVAWDRLPNRRVPRDPIPDLVPDLAVEVLSESNTKKEMERKVLEYFTTGVRLVWLVDPDPRTVEVYTAPDQCTLLREDDTLDGGAVLPGFTLSVRELFARAG